MRWSSDVGANSNPVAFVVWIGSRRKRDRHSWKWRCCRCAIRQGPQRGGGLSVFSSNTSSDRTPGTVQTIRYFGADAQKMVRGDRSGAFVQSQPPQSRRSPSDVGRMQPNQIMSVHRHTRAKRPKSMPRPSNGGKMAAGAVADLGNDGTAICPTTRFGVGRIRV